MRQVRPARAIALALLLIVAGACAPRRSDSERAGGVEGGATPRPAPTDTMSTGPPPGDWSPARPGSMVRVRSPRPGQVVTSPLLVRGVARGPWFFEADFPVRLHDHAGREIALGIARAQGEWMTEEFVPFEATLSFAAPAGDSGTVVLQRNNPSDLRENDAELRIPVRFR